MKKRELVNLLENQEPIWFYQKSTQQSFWKSFLQANLTKATNWLIIVLTFLLIQLKGFVSKLEVSFALIFILLGVLNAYSNTTEIIQENQSITGFTENSVFKVYDGLESKIRIIPFEDIDEIKIEKTKNGTHTITCYYFLGYSYFGQLFKVKMMEFNEAKITKSQIIKMRQLLEGSKFDN